MNAIEAKAWFSQAWPGRPDAAPKPFFKSARSNASHMAEGRQNDGRIALILHTSDGCPWPLTMSAGTEIFIGHYRRLNEFNCGARLIYFQGSIEAGPPAATKADRTSVV